MSRFDYTVTAAATTQRQADIMEVLCDRFCSAINKAMLEDDKLINEAMAYGSNRASIVVTTIIKVLIQSHFHFMHKDIPPDIGMDALVKMLTTIGKAFTQDCSEHCSECAAEGREHATH